MMDCTFSVICKLKALQCAVYIIKFLTQFEHHSILIERNANPSSPINMSELLESEK